MPASSVRELSTLPPVDPNLPADLFCAARFYDLPVMALVGQ
jgi:hypothetical protein